MILFFGTHSQSFLVVGDLDSHRIGLVPKVPLTGCQGLRGPIAVQKDNINKTVLSFISWTKECLTLTKQPHHSFSVCKNFSRLLCNCTELSAGISSTACCTQDTMQRECSNGEVCFLRCILRHNFQIYSCTQEPRWK